VGLKEKLQSAFRAKFFSLVGAPLQPWDDYWYGPRGFESAAGVFVSPDRAMRATAVYACVRVISETVASLPLIIYKRLPDGGKERAVNHPLYKVLHDSPNQWQTAFEWREMLQAHMELRGNNYSRIVPSPQRAIDQLVPIHPDRVQVLRQANGRLQYKVTSWVDGSVEYLAPEEVYCERGLSSDGMTGVSPITLAMEAIGVELAQQDYVSRFFANDSKPSGVLEHPKQLNDVVAKRIKEGWQQSQTRENRHGVAVLEEGMQYKPISISPKDTMIIESRQFSRSQIASVFRVPLHKIGDLTRATFSNIEQQSIEFLTDSIRPRLVRIERRIQQDLLDPLDLGDGNEYFCEFLIDALLRGDQKSRYDSYAIGIQWGWFCPNDVRRMENMNPIANGDEYLRPLNMVPAGTPGPDQNDAAAGQEDSTAVNARLKEFAISAAERVVRKEVKALRNAWAKSEGDIAAFKTAATDFYATHRDFVAETMRISSSASDEYCRRAHASIINDTTPMFASIAYIEESGAEFLAELALKEKR
jgi:HK97 family phage portal protein